MRRCTRRASQCPMRAGSYVCAFAVVCERVIACMCLRVCLRLPFDCHLNLWHVQQSYGTADRQTGRREERRGERKEGGRTRRRRRSEEVEKRGGGGGEMRTGSRGRRETGRERR